MITVEIFNRRKTIMCISSLVIGLTLILSGCHMKHEWKEATCDAPRTCTVGGEVEGEPLGHAWEEATCNKAKTCTRCGITEGEPLGHDWKDASCETPKVCTRCRETEGEALGHNFSYATTKKPKTCRICGKTEGNPVSISVYDLNKYYEGYYKGAFNEELLRFCRRLSKGDQEIIDILSADDGSVIKSVTVDTSQYSGSFQAWGNNEPFAVMLFPCKRGADSSRIVVIGWEGNILVDTDIPINVLDPSDNSARASWVCTNNERIKGIVDKNNSLICFIDLDTGKVLQPGETDAIVNGDFRTTKFGERHGEPYDETKWKYHLWQSAIEGYLACGIDGKSWVYLDKDDNEIATFMDATDFNDAGYALVSDDRNKYYVIDSEFNKVGEIDGEDFASAGMCGGHLFSLWRDDGSRVEVIVK